MAGEAGGLSLRGAGLPGVRVPCLSLLSCAGGCAKGKSSAGRGGPFFLPGQGQAGSWAGLCFLLAFAWDRWPPAPPGGPEQGWESLSSRSSQPVPAWGVGELEGGVDGLPMVGTGAWALIPALPEHLAEETPATGRGLASLPSAVEKGSLGSWERRAELWGLVGSG